MDWFFRLMAKLMGRNLAATPVNVIIDQMNEKRPLPTGMTELEEWTDRIISGTLLPADRESQQFALCTMIMHLSPTQDHETDGYFIKSLRKGAINQIAHAKMMQIKNDAVAKQQKEQLEKEMKEREEKEAAVQAAETSAVTHTIDDGDLDGPSPTTSVLEH
jgi:hypothetical protein